MSEAILLLAHGGANSLEELPAFLSAIRGGRPYSQAFLDDVTERYRLIGGKSPLLTITKQLAYKLEQALGMPVVVGMKYGEPSIAAAVTKLNAAGITACTVICLAPHFSALSIGQYEKALKAAQIQYAPTLCYRFVKSWGDFTSFIEGWAANIRPFIPPTHADTHHVVFTAHSLPARILDAGDPYVSELNMTAELIAQQIGLSKAHWSLCFQSAAITGEPWLSPTLDDILDKLYQKNIHLILAPIGFVAEHVEVLYDLDIVFAKACQQYNIQLTRTPLFNDSEQFVQILAAIFRSHGINPHP